MSCAVSPSQHPVQALSVRGRERWTHSCIAATVVRDGPAERARLHVGGDVLLGLEDEEGLARLADLHVKRDALIVDRDADLLEGVREDGERRRRHEGGEGEGAGVSSAAPRARQRARAYLLVDRAEDAELAEAHVEGRASEFDVAGLGGALDDNHVDGAREGRRVDRLVVVDCLGAHRESARRHELSSPSCDGRPPRGSSARGEGGELTLLTHCMVERPLQSCLVGGRASVRSGVRAERVRRVERGRRTRASRVGDGGDTEHPSSLSCASKTPQMRLQHATRETNDPQKPK